jgi:hypothetical protein
MILFTDEKVKIKACLFKFFQTVHQMTLEKETHKNSFPHGKVSRLFSS